MSLRTLRLSIGAKAWRGSGARVVSRSHKEQAQEPVVTLGVNHRDALPADRQCARVGVLKAFDKTVAAWPGHVVAHRTGGAGHAERAVHVGTKAPMSKPEGAESDTPGADQSRDPRVTETWGWSTPPVRRGWRGECDPLKGWATRDTALADRHSTERAAVDGTGA